MQRYYVKLTTWGNPSPIMQHEDKVLAYWVEDQRDGSHNIVAIIQPGDHQTARHYLEKVWDDNINVTTLQEVSDKFYPQGLVVTPKQFDSLGITKSLVLPLWAKNKGGNRVLILEQDCNGYRCVYENGPLQPIVMRLCDLDIESELSVDVFFYTVELELTQFDGGVEDPAAWINSKNVSIYAKGSGPLLRKLDDIDLEYEDITLDAIREFLDSELDSERAERAALFAI